jgi:hypothetical protein
LNIFKRIKAKCGTIQMWTYPERLTAVIAAKGASTTY